MTRTVQVSDYRQKSFYMAVLGLGFLGLYDACLNLALLPTAIELARAAGQTTQPDSEIWQGQSTPGQLWLAIAFNILCSLSMVILSVSWRRQNHTTRAILLFTGVLFYGFAEFCDYGPNTTSIVVLAVFVVAAAKALSFVRDV
ncbi:MAG: hypothetical protein KF857_11060 [Fimbriimonadaceae bacterium]|nr:hypothetical protein [Fimbriimonadaceae bacterium]